MDSLCGKMLESSFVEVVLGEINQIFLQICDDWFSISGENGFNSLKFSPSSDPITLDLELVRMPMITQFEGFSLLCVNNIEDFGFEISFGDFDDKSLIIKAHKSGLKVGTANFISKI